ncbi:MAG: globin [Pseudomonadota bacterium]
MKLHDVIHRSLEAAAAELGDPTERIYAQLFLRAPELEALFVLDADGGVRGEMLSRVFETVLNIASDDELSKQLLQAEFLNHCGYGVPPEQFGTLFDVVHEELRDGLGSQWTDEFATAWQIVLRRLAALLAQLREAEPSGID